MRNCTSIIFFGTVLLLVYLFPTDFDFPEIPYISTGTLMGDFIPGSMVLVGDIFLGREVENLIARNSPMYPFIGTNVLLSSSDITLGNFEGAVPETHVQTPAFDLTFSVKNTYLNTLAEVGFDVLSFANNHTYDFGEAGLNNARKKCENYSLKCIGDPNLPSKVSVTITNLGDTRVGVLALHAIEKDAENFDITELIEMLVNDSDIQVAYLHWGKEYEQIHSEKQQALAESLIESGFDIIVGHHPHVVQDIEIYKGKPIFYSLGNFVFDQYFSPEVQTGLVLKIVFEKESFRIIPVLVESITTQSQPQIVNDVIRGEFFSTTNLNSDIASYVQGTAWVFPNSK